MFKALFITTLFITLVVNILFLFATKEKPPDLSTSTYISISQEDTQPSHRRLFLRSNDFYDYSSSSNSNLNQKHILVEPFYSNNNVDNNDNFKNNNNNSSQTTNKYEKSLYDMKHEEDEKFKSDYPYEERKKVQLEDENGHYLRKRLFQIKKSKLNFKRINKNNNPNPVEESKARHNSIVSENKSFLEYEKNFFENNDSDLINHDKSKLEQSSDNISTSISAPSNEIRPSSSTTASFLNDDNNSFALNDNNYKNSHYNDDYNDDFVKRSRSNNYIGNLDGRVLGTTKAYNDDEKSKRKTYLDILVKSSRNQVLISIDNVVVYNSQLKAKLIDSNQSEKNLQNSDRQTIHANAKNQETDYDDDAESRGRGVHVLVLNQFNGSIMSKRIFDTYSPQQDEELCLYINMISDGRILIFAIRDEASFRMPLNSQARILLQRLGSEHIMKLRWRDMWAFIVRKTTLLDSNIQVGESHLGHLIKARVYNLAEGLTKSTSFNEWARPVVIETKVELFSSDERNENFRDCKWKTNNNLNDYNRRIDFCNKVEGYGRVCDCDYPATISFDPLKIENSQLNEIPIIVMASNRPYYLYRMLRSLLVADGVNSSMITVFIDGFHDEPLQVSQLFNLRAIQKKSLGRHSSRISHNYKNSLRTTFDELFPKAKFAIIFEEDLDIAKDALIYFNQTLQVLRKDSSLYCVSAWNDQGYEHSVGDSSLMYRIETMPGLGWMLSRDLFKLELEPNWPSVEQQHDWDMWIRTEAIRKNRECIIPDISRTFHFGSIGTNINSYFQKQYFSKHAFKNNFLQQQQQKDFSINIEQLFANNYERMIDKLVREATIIIGNNTTTTTNNNNNNNNVTENTNYLCSLAKINTNDVKHSFPFNKSRNKKRIIENKSYKLEEFFKQELEGNFKGKENKDDNNSPFGLNNNNNNNNNKNNNNVIYIEMIDKQDYGNWLRLANCWHIWDLDARGQHNSMWRLFINGKPTLVIGSPASPYSRFKPPYLKPFKLI